MEAPESLIESMVNVIEHPTFFFQGRDRGQAWHEEALWRDRQFCQRRMEGRKLVSQSSERTPRISVGYENEGYFHVSRLKVGQGDLVLCRRVLNFIPQLEAPRLLPLATSRKNHGL